MIGDIRDKNSRKIYNIIVDAICKNIVNKRG